MAARVDASARKSVLPAVDPVGHHAARARRDAAAGVAAAAAEPGDAAVDRSAIPLDDLRRRASRAAAARHRRRQDLHSSFDERRGDVRVHEAIDILAPRNTPVLAVEDGTIARLFHERRRRHHDLPVRSDDDVRLLLRAPRAVRGRPERRRARQARHQVIGYVGTSGNAPKDTPHLHFAIFKLTEKKRWWEGAPIDPFLVLGR